MKIQFLPDGPILISDIELLENDIQRATGNVALCRCGLSANKPFCDGSHKDKFEADGQEMDAELPDVGGSKIVVTNLESFLDYESEHWLDLAIRSSRGTVEIKGVDISAYDKDRILDEVEKYKCCEK